MKRLIKIFPILILIPFISMMFNTVSNADGQISDKIRIGLFFTDTSNNTDTALKSFTINADLGIQVGFLFYDQFSIMYEEPAANPVTIRKDSYFVFNNNTYTEYKPTDTIIPDGLRIGPFHVQIGGTYADANTTRDQVMFMKQAGVAAYPVYADSWQIWTGFYTGQDQAQSDIDNNLRLKLGDAVLTVVQPVAQPAANRIAAVSSNNEAVALFGSSTASLQIRPKIENTSYMTKVNGKPYRGDIEVRRLPDSDMTVINILPLKQYLYGVVPCETEGNSHPEALKAQAVAARTYALGSLGKHAGKFFDLCATASCQVYKGYSAELPATNKAVDDTMDKRIKYNGSLARVYYFSSSGGRTEDAKNVWGGDYPYLKSVDDGYEAGNSWNYNWNVTYTASRIREVFLGRNIDLGSILSVSVTKRSEAGRVTELVIKGSKDQRVYTKWNSATALSSLSSQWYSIMTDSDVVLAGAGLINTRTQLGDKKVMTMDGLKTIKALDAGLTVIGANGLKKTVPSIPTWYKFTGKGWGHAVGMSQEGAKGMAKAGFTYEQILAHYFPGTRVE